MDIECTVGIHNYFMEIHSCVRKSNAALLTIQLWGVSVGYQIFPVPTSGKLQMR